MTHVFDRIPNDPDGRDWKMSRFLADDPLFDMDRALNALVARKWTAKTVKVWAQAVSAYLHSLVDPPSRTWPDRLQLDQGSTGHCVGFGWCQWGNTGPVEDSYTNDEAHTLYYDIKVIEGEPGQENGAQVRSGAKAMQARGKLSNYVFASSVAEIRAWVLSKGPVVVGTDWMSGMDSPDTQGLVHPTGSVRGGHCYVLDGYDSATDRFRFQNSWGTSYAANGYFYMSASDFSTLFANQGDACAALELS